SLSTTARETCIRSAAMGERETGSWSRAMRWSWSKLRSLPVSWMLMRDKRITQRVRRRRNAPQRRNALGTQGNSRSPKWGLRQALFRYFADLGLFLIRLRQLAELGAILFRELLRFAVAAADHMGGSAGGQKRRVGIAQELVGILYDAVAGLRDARAD